jgi:2-polyprenyl-6-methoxyphenol hydroxylase-like FAD-dependent oxidoreductase
VNIACVGGGPGGLFLATLVKRQRPASRVTVFERNRPDDTFGFGVVFSDAALGAVNAADPVLRDALAGHGRHWDDIAIRAHGQQRRCGGNGMAAVSRPVLLGLLRRRAAEAGVSLRFEYEVRDPAQLDGFDLVVISDGVHSRLRDAYAEVFRPRVHSAAVKFIWLATTYPFEGLTFVHRRGPHGAFAAHAYPYSDGMSTFIVETDEESWRAAGLAGADRSTPGGADEASRAYLQALFAPDIDGHPLLSNDSRWGNFRTVRAASWRHGHRVLLGDAAHTAHFSVGSGTKMAMEDAVALAAAIETHGGDLDAVLAEYEATRRPAVEKIQSSARPSLSWWEHFGRYLNALGATQFAFHFLTRSISRAKLAGRDPAYVAQVDAWWRDRHGADPLGTPLDVRGIRLPGRLVRAGDQEIVASDGTTLAMAGTGSAASGPAAAVAVASAVASGAAASGTVVSGAVASGAAAGIWVDAPSDERDLPGAEAAIDAAAAARIPLIGVRNGSTLTRVLLAERVRFVHGTAAMIATEEDDDAARTLILSGRADLVARPGRPP